MKPPLKFLLLTLLGLSVLSGVHQVFGLSALAPQWQGPRTLRLPGYNVSFISSQPGTIGREFSTGTTRRFRLQAQGQAPPIDLTIMPVNSLKAELMDLSRITDGRSALGMKQPQLLAHRPAGAAARPEDQLAITKANGRTRLQTCLLRSGLAGYTQTALGDEHLRQVLKQFDDRPAQKYLDYGARFLGLQPITYSECLLVQMETATTATDQSSLLNAWAALRPSLPQAE